MRVAAAGSRAELMHYGIADRSAPLSVVLFVGSQATLINFKSNFTFYQGKSCLTFKVYVWLLCRRSNHNRDLKAALLPSW